MKLTLQGGNPEWHSPYGCSLKSLICAIPSTIMRCHHLFLILKSLPLSIIVTLRMIMPIILIFMGSTVISLVLGILTLGFSSLIVTPATLTFITIYGTYVALDQMGKGGLIDWRLMINYSVAFGVVIGLIKMVGLFAVQFLATFTAQQHLGLNISLQSLQSADEAVQSAFVLSTLSFWAIFSLIFLASLQALFAVPMAAAAHSTYHKASSGSSIEYIGKSFLPLFLVAAITTFLLFFFKIFAVFALIFGTFVFQISAFIYLAADKIEESGIAGFIELFSLIDPTATLISIASILGVLWLKAWVWSVAALAFLKHEKITTKRAETANRVPAMAPQDLRALRKARDNQNR